MRMLVNVLILIVAVSGLAVATSRTSKADYKVIHISDRQLGVVCLDGADPTTYPKLHGQDALIISCGKADSE